MNKPYIYPTVKKYLENGQDDLLLEFCNSIHPVDLAHSLESAHVDHVVEIMTRLGPVYSSRLLAEMNPGYQTNILLKISDEVLSRIINEMRSDDRVDMIRSIPEERKQKLMQMLAKAERLDIVKLESYQEGTAGSLMTSEYAALSKDITAGEAIDRLRIEAPEKETIYYAYVIDEQRRLLGTVSLRELILASPESRVEELMHHDPVKSTVQEDQEEVARKMKKYDLLAIPVTNGNEALVGIVTYDDIQDVIVEEATEDFHRFGGMTHKFPDLHISLRDAGFMTMIQRRLPWLLVLVFMNIFSGAGIAHFEDTIEAVVALVFFLPLLIDSGGNAGSQSATLMVRALAIGDVKLKDWFRLLSKEVTVAIGIGLAMGLAVSLIGIFRAGPEVAVVVAMTMVLTVLFGSLVGMSLPFLLTRFKMDPATASAPLITSIADIGGVLIYFSIATWYLRDMIAAAGAA